MMQERVSESYGKERLLELFPYTGLVFSLSCIKGISLSL